MTNHMRAAVLDGGQLSLHRDYPKPHPAPGEALIRLRVAGICATDLELAAGYQGGFQGILGHEFVGDVVEAPGNEGWIGERVVGEINIGCGQCDRCDRGMGKHCRSRRVLGIVRHNGVFADYLILPVANLHRVPQQVSDEAAAFTEPLAAALEILEQKPLSSSQRVYLVGDGRLGQLIAQVLAMTGCDLTVIGRHAPKLALLSNLGIRTQVNSDGSAIDQLARHPADVVVEATGSADGFMAAQRLVRSMGTIVLKSTFAGGPVGLNLSSIVVEEVSIIGSRCGPFEPALRLLAERRIEVEPLIHARYTLDEAERAFHHAAQPGVLKVLLTP